jgi:hypothetical protein
MRPEPGRALLDARIAEATPVERMRWSQDLRRTGLELVWRQSDEAGPMTELERAYFLIDRLYPEMPPQHRAQFRAQLEREWRAGRWHGFRRPE